MRVEILTPLRGLTSFGYESTHGSRRGLHSSAPFRGSRGCVALRSSLLFAALFFQLAFAFFLKLAAFAFQGGVFETLPDALLGAAFEPLHLGFDAALDLVDGRWLAQLILRHDLVLIDFHDCSPPYDLCRASSHHWRRAVKRREKRSVVASRQMDGRAPARRCVTGDDAHRRFFGFDRRLEG